MLRLSFDHYTILISDHLPLQDEAYRKHATLIEQRESEAPRDQEDFLYLAVSHDDRQWPFLIEVMGAKASFPLHGGPSDTLPWW